MVTRSSRTEGQIDHCGRTEAEWVGTWSRIDERAKRLGMRRFSPTGRSIQDRRARCFRKKRGEEDKDNPS